MFSFTISGFILHCFPAITVGKTTFLIPVTCLPSPNLNFVLIGKYSISFILFSVRFNINLLNHFSSATVLAHAVLITADFNASATNIFNFDRFSVVNTIFTSSSKSMSAVSLSLSSRRLIFWSFLWGHLFPQRNFESHITHMEFFSFLSTGFHLLTCLICH